MAASAHPSITDLAKGHEFDVADIEISREGIDRYLAAVGDTNDIYAQTGLVPPLAVAALALTRLLEMIDLPFGTLHIGQEIEVRGGVPMGSRLSMRGWIAQRSVRAGAVISVIEFSLTPFGASEPGLSGRTTVMVQGAA
ncbi:MAG TPA: MaoC family dehydratase N-terminal domain-containing protein [Dehalococcoidia bacterium]|jgi:hypothetical protein